MLYSSKQKRGSSSGLKAKVQTRPLGETPKAEKARPMEKSRKVVR